MCGEAGSAPGTLQSPLRERGHEATVFCSVTPVVLQEASVSKRRVLEQRNRRDPEGAPRPGAFAGGGPSAGGKGGCTGRAAAGSRSR